ncbi:hypothetical protein ACGGAQ_04410 [Micromonospora sp. NPDC047557]|uniref:hypothetical protein n=1 Tax=Micromonospora sp. NPDC047557 TaxID=3364250 RepID=UPI0037213D7D
MAIDSSKGSAKNEYCSRKQGNPYGEAACHLEDSGQGLRIAGTPSEGGNVGRAIEQLRQALASAEEPTLASIGGPAAVLAASDDLPSTSELPFVISLLMDEWASIADRSALVDLVVTAVGIARPFELDDLLDLVLSDETVVPDLAGQLEKPLKLRAAGEDAAAGIALEAWLRLNLGRWTRSPLVLLGALDEHAASAANAESGTIDETFLQRLVRCLGAAGEHWHEHGSEMAAALRGLLHHTAVDDNIAFELAMLELRKGLEGADPVGSVAALREARSHLALCAQYEDRIDAEIFGAAIDALLAFVTGALPTPGDLDRLKALVFDFRLNSLSEYPHWRQPRADTAVHWLGLVDALTRLQDLDRGWLNAAELIADMATVYRAHRTLTLVQPAAVVSRDQTPEVTTDCAALPALLQPRLVTAVRRQGHGLDMLDHWLATVEQTAEPEDVAAIRDIRDRVRFGGADQHPKVTSVDLSALREVLGIPEDDLPAVQAALGAYPEMAHKLNALAAAKAEATKVDVNIYFQRTFARVRDELLAMSGFTGERARRVEQVALALLRYVRWRGSVTAGSKLAASFQRRFSSADDAPKEAEFADDLHGLLAMTLEVVPIKEVSHIANGRIDLIADFGAISLVIECKRELHDASMEHLASLYAFQAAEYDWADPGVAFLVVLDLTKKTRRVQLGESVRVVSIPPAGGGQPETVMVSRVQANLPPPSYLSTPSAARARVAAGSALENAPEIGTTS